MGHRRLEEERKERRIKISKWPSIVIIKDKQGRTHPLAVSFLEANASHLGEAQFPLSVTLLANCKEAQQKGTMLNINDMFKCQAEHAEQILEKYKEGIPAVEQTWKRKKAEWKNEQSKALLVYQVQSKAWDEDYAKALAEYIKQA